MKIQETEMLEKVNELKEIQKESLKREEGYINEVKRLKKRLEDYELYL